MTTEFYILKIRILSALRWLRELGFIRIVLMILLAAGIFNSFLDIHNTSAGITSIILLNAGIIYTVHFSRKDGFFLDSLDINKKFLFALEYFIYSIPFLVIILFSQNFLFAAMAK